jgi:DNA-binding response OmpR family regulator
MTAKILVVDDEQHIRFFLERLLQRDGFTVTAVPSGEAALAQIEVQEFDLALLDVKMPGISGVEVLKQLHEKWPQTVAILLTAHASLDTAVTALRHSAHDYLFKPCDPDTVRASVQEGLQKRQQILQQRTVFQQIEDHLLSSLSQVRAAAAGELPESDAPAEETAAPERFLHKGSLIMDLSRHIFTINGRLVELSPIEFKVIAYLLSHSPRVVSPQEIVKEVQGYESSSWEASEVTRAHIYRIRQKMKKAAGESADVIQTVRGVGYAILP